ncbi:hypothetical protein SAMN02799625_06115 [Methylobacterium sp. UNC300MFChir4.1]|uniref:hypothetical protein n=1 Tax=Methylobacterium sp. UNC300MFChir4.1 TaxID=1502747 RepID=UPI0008D01929|nr:hypothetical protein [Methylobacterium sp. UNC300MFChir4.1]SEP42572.1 hypothetical protein SAMN02799625_06115 [Methylobacterium sp. UNC300MFChir4.1]
MSASAAPADLPPAVASWRDQIERLSEIVPLAAVADLRNALEIEAQAKRRLADEYDAAQKRWPTLACHTR